MLRPEGVEELNNLNADLPTTDKNLAPAVQRHRSQAAAHETSAWTAAYGKASCLSLRAHLVVFCLLYYMEKEARKCYALAIACNELLVLCSYHCQLTWPSDWCSYTSSQMLDG